MFQNEDWEIGEDFLDDFCETNEQKKTEVDLEANEKSPKKTSKKSENRESSSFSFSPPINSQKLQLKPANDSSSRINRILQICRKNPKSQNSQIPVENNSEQISSNPKTIDQASRRNKLLEIFKGNCESLEVQENQKLTKEPERPKSPEIFKVPQNNLISNLKESTNKKEKSVSKSLETPFGNPRSQSREEARKNLINSILKKTPRKNDEFPENKIESDESNSQAKTLSRKNLMNSILKKSTERSESSQSTFIEVQEPEILNTLNHHVESLPKSKRNVSFLNEDDRLEKRRKLIFDSFKKCSEENNSRSKNDSCFNMKPQDDSGFKNDSNSKNDFKTDSRSRNDSKSSRSAKQVVVRKFPGPAGILPDDLDLSKLPMAYLSSLDENENDRVIDESRLSDFCSQNTKNLFTGGAWQSMIDDLPADFLQGYDIATVRHNARKGLYKTERVPIIAGIIHHIDSNWVENPLIILKDSTDQIEVSLQMCIFNMYPNTIEPGAVILMKEVGVIFSRKFLYALVHPINIVAVYNEKGRIVTTQAMDEILVDEEGNQRTNQGEVSGCSFNSDLEIHRSLRTEDQNLSEGNSENKISECKKSIGKSQEASSGNPQPQSSNNPLEKPKILNVEILPGPSKQRLKSSSQKLKTSENSSQGFNDEDDEAFLSLNVEEISASHGLNNFASSTLIGSQISPEKRGTTSVNKNCALREKTPKKCSKVRNYLKQFRSEDDLTQPKANIVEEGKEDKKYEKRKDKNLQISNFADLLGIDDQEIEEEMSQMDFDSIVAKDDESRKEFKSPRKNPEIFSFEDADDVMLSQIDMDNFVTNREDPHV